MGQKNRDRKQGDGRLFIGFFMLFVTLLFGGTAWMLSVRISRMGSQDEQVEKINFIGKRTKMSLGFAALDEG